MRCSRAAPQRERRVAGDRTPQAPEDRRFGGAQHEQAVRGQQPVERLLNAAAGLCGQVDQQVPAEDDVVGLAVGSE